MKTKHTKGEWVVSKSGNQNFNLCVISEKDGGSICHITNWLEAPANASLIAVAPEMLQALKEIAKGEGRYSMDALEHASNTIVDMKSIAEEAIKIAEEY